MHKCIETSVLVNSFQCAKKQSVSQLECKASKKKKKNHSNSIQGISGHFRRYQKLVRGLHWLQMGLTGGSVAFRGVLGGLRGVLGGMLSGVLQGGFGWFQRRFLLYQCGSGRFRKFQSFMDFHWLSDELHEGLRGVLKASQETELA